MKCAVGKDKNLEKMKAALAAWEPYACRHTLSGGEPLMTSMTRRWAGEFFKEIKTAYPGVGTSMVSNGSKLDAAWVEEFGELVDTI